MHAISLFAGSADNDWTHIVYPVLASFCMLIVFGGLILCFAIMFVWSWWNGRRWRKRRRQ